MAYPTGNARTEALKAKSTTLGPLDDGVRRMQENNATLQPFFRMCLYQAERSGQRHMGARDSIAGILRLYLSEPRHASPQEVLDMTAFYKLATQFLAHEHDFDYMVLDSCNVALQKGEVPQAIDLGKEKEGLAQLYPKLLLAAALEIERDLSEVTDDDLAISHLADIVPRILDYWTKNIRTGPLESYPELHPLKPNLSPKVWKMINSIVPTNLSTYVQPGGIEFREALAQLILPAERILDVGSGDGFMLPCLAPHADIVAIEPMQQEYLSRTIEVLRKEGRNIELAQTRIEEFKGRADAAVISTAIYFKPKPTVRKLAELADRVVIGVPVANGPLISFAHRKSERQSRAQIEIQQAFQPHRWERELAKHYDDVTVLCYDEHGFVVVAKR